MDNSSDFENSGGNTIEEDRERGQNGKSVSGESKWKDRKSCPGHLSWCMIYYSVTWSVLVLFLGIEALFIMCDVSLSAGILLIIVSILGLVVTIVGLKMEIGITGRLAAFIVIATSILVGICIGFFLYVLVQAVGVIFKFSAEGISKPSHVERSYASSHNMLSDNLKKTDVKMAAVYAIINPLFDDIPEPPYPDSWLSDTLRMRDVLQDVGMLCYFSKYNLLSFITYPFDCMGYFDTDSPYYNSPKNDIVVKVYYSLYTSSIIYNARWLVTTLILISIFLVFGLILICCVGSQFCIKLIC